MITTDFKGYDNLQFSYLLRKMWQADLELQRWAKANNKETLFKSLERDIRVLREAEARLSGETT